MGVLPCYANGKQTARVTCDCCGKEVVIGIPTTNYHRNMTPSRRAKIAAEVKTSKPVVQKMRSVGWVVNKAKVVCNTCVKKGNEEKMNQKISVKKVASTVTKIEPNMKSTPVQRREIRKWLDDLYDIDRCCYKENNSDHTVADLCEGKVLWGWVKEIREADYGEGGGNEEASLMVKEVKKLSDAIDTALVTSEVAQQDFRKAYEANAAKMQKAHDGLQARHKEVNELIKKIKLKG